jgi:hypothetical protein
MLVLPIQFVRDKLPQYEQSRRRQMAVGAI